MKRVKNYIVASYDELMTKVTWPTWEELQDSTILVLVSSFIFAIVVWLVDMGLSEVLKLVYSIFK
ncbi:MAG TPA: preprotein translocase subunit SecE [Bacteroidia bacterium]|nr:preprotein translocase subunit SecE [Bacteroidia bacterium]